MSAIVQDYSPAAFEMPQLTDFAEIRKTGKALIGYVVFMLMCHLALLVPAFSTARIFLRVGPFAGSIVMFLYYHNRLTKRHPSCRMLGFALIVLALSQFHPDTNRLSGLAQLAMLTAVALPAFWVGSTGMRTATFRVLLGIFWTYNSLSAFFGVLQVRYPGRFLPNLAINFANMSDASMEGLKVTLVTGERVFRPLGLTDSPGGAAVCSIYAILFGLGMFITARRLWMRSLGASTMMLGMFCIYLSYIRAMLVVSIVCVAVYLLMLARRKDVARLSGAIILVVSVGIASFFWALNYGGQGMLDRFQTLISEPPTQVYLSARGQFLTETFTTLIPTYPLGAGAGRYGMMYGYFGDKSQESLWAEIQLPAWILDGGVPLAIFYISAVVVALYVAYKIARLAPTKELGLWGTLIFAYDIGIVADTFGNPTFNNETGMEFWLLNAALFATYLSAYEDISVREEVVEPTAESLPAPELAAL